MEHSEARHRHGRSNAACFYRHKKSCAERGSPLVAPYLSPGVSAGWALGGHKHQQ